MLHSRQRHSTSCGTLNSNAHTKGGRRMSRCFASAYQLLLSITLFNLEQGSTAHTLQHPFLSLDFRKPNVYCYAVPGNHYIIMPCYAHKGDGHGLERHRDPCTDCTVHNFILLVLSKN